MHGWQPTGGKRLALTTLCVSLVTTLTLSAQSTAIIGVTSGAGYAMDELSRRGVFEGPDGVEGPAADGDRRIRWLTFYLIYADEVLSRYAPGGASGARFDLFQFAGFADAQPFGYPIHIVVAGRHTTLMGIVDTAEDKRLAEARAREVPGVLDVENALVVAP